MTNIINIIKKCCEYIYKNWLANTIIDKYYEYIYKYWLHIYLLFLGFSVFCLLFDLCFFVQFGFFWKAIDAYKTEWISVSLHVFILSIIEFYFEYYFNNSYLLKLINFLWKYHIFRFIFEKPYVEIKWFYIKYIRASGYKNFTDLYLHFRIMWCFSKFVAVFMPFWSGCHEDSRTTPNSSEFLDFIEKIANEKNQDVDPAFIAFILKDFLRVFDLNPFWWFCIFWVFYIIFLIDLRYSRQNLHSWALIEQRIKWEEEYVAKYKDWADHYGKHLHLEFVNPRRRRRRRRK
jgi:hypothetical protein